MFCQLLDDFNKDKAFILVPLQENKALMLCSATDVLVESIKSSSRDKVHNSRKLLVAHFCKFTKPGRTLHEAVYSSMSAYIYAVSPTPAMYFIIIFYKPFAPLLNKLKSLLKSKAEGQMDFCCFFRQLLSGG